VPKSPGCRRCRLDLIQFTRTVKLPRFSMHQGDEWHLPQSRYQLDGSAELGAGIVPRDAFKILVVDDTRACGCPCKRPLDHQA
jgi:hypothetical protein